MSTPYGLWSGEEPPLGLVTVRDPRFIPPRHAQVLRNATLDDLASERRLGWRKRHHTSLGSSCALPNGTTEYAEVTSVAADALGTSWTQEFRFLFPDFMPVGDATVYAKRTSGANTDHFWLYYDQSAGVIRFQMDTASEAVSMVGSTTLLANTAYSYSVRRDGDVINLILNGDGASPEATLTLVAGSGEVNKVNTARWLYWARSNSANGLLADDQHSRHYLSEHRDWTIARSNAQLLANFDIELATTDNTSLRHYRQFRQGPDKRVFRDSRSHISLANRRNAWARPCGPNFVDRHYPESCGPWNESAPGIERGERWRRFNAVGTAEVGQEDAFTPNAGQEGMVNVLRDGIAKWHDRIEIIPERTGVLECIADWALGSASNDPAYRLEFLANDTVRATYTKSAAPVTVTTTATLLACTPYAIDVVRNNVDFRLHLFRKDTGALIEEVSAVVATGVSDAASGGPFTLGRQRNNSNPFLGAIGNHHMAPDITSPRARRTAPGYLTAQALISMPALRLGDRVADLATNVDLVSDCTPADPDIADGPKSTDCAAGVRTLFKGVFQGLYEYKRASPEITGVERTIISVFDGTIYESINHRGADLTNQSVRRGLSGGKTCLGDWAQHRDQVFYGNGKDVNLVRHADGGWARVGVIAPTTAPTLTGTTGGSLTQDDDAIYSYFVTFLDPAVGGTRSLPGLTATVTLTAGQNQVDLTAIPVSTDPDRPNMQREIWRTKWGITGQGGDFYRVTTLLGNTTTTYSDTASDASLLPVDKIPLTEFGFFLGGLFPKCRYFEEFQGRLWAAGDPENPSRLYFSPVNQPQSNPVPYFIDLTDKGTGDPITAVMEMWDQLYIFTERDIFVLKSSGRATSFAIDRAVSGIGATGTWGISKTHGRVFFVNAGQKRIYTWQGQGDPEYISWPVEDTVEGYNGDAMRYSFSFWYERLGVVIFLFSTGTTDDAEMGDEGIPENDRALLYDPARNQWEEWDWDVAVLAAVSDPTTDENRLYAGDYMGFVREMDFNENDGYDQTGDKWGIIDESTSTTTVLDLNDESDLAVMNLPVVEDGLMGCPFFLIRPDANGIDEVVAKGRIAHNAASQVTMQVALTVTPQALDRWCIGGIHYRHRTPWIDWDRNLHLKLLHDITIFYRLETGNAQDSQARAIMHTYQDGEENVAAVAIDLSLGAPTAVPDLRIEVFETARFHGFEVESFYPDEPLRVEGLTLQYTGYGQPLEVR